MPFTPEKRRAYDAARTSESRRRNDARAQRRSSHTIVFVGVDGEGVQRPDKAHDYNLLTVGDKAFHHPDGRRLRTEEIFQFLWESRVPNAVHVGFFLGYDLAMWLRDLPEERARMLLTTAGREARKRTGPNPRPFPVEWKSWTFDMMPGGKRFMLKPKRGRYSPMWICDVGPFYQSSLLKAIDPASWPEPICSAEEFALLKRGKEQRGNKPVPYGTPVDAETLRYNALENDVLARLMERTNEGFVSMGVRLKRTQWFGPGQAAQFWLKVAAESHTREACAETVPDWAFDAARRSYFGGWFEIMAHGHVPGTTWEYDINSAYPHIMSQIPCLLHGRWSRGWGWNRSESPQGPPDGRLRLVHVEVAGRDPFIGTLSHRTKGGSIQHPRWTAGWHWQHELNAAIRAGLVDSVNYREWVEYEPCSCDPPFQGLAELYNLRLVVGKNTPQGKAMKVVYNSAYGKSAQSIGTPMFGNSIVASLITAGTRTMILDAIATHPRRSAAVVMIATDGIYFTDPHPALELHETRLGAWGEQRKENLTLFKPGVYWDDAAREAAAQGLGPKMKSRGINARALAKILPSVDRQWTEGGWPWPAFDLKIPFGVISPIQALARGKWELCGQVMTDGSSLQSADPGKKRIPFHMKNSPDGLIRTEPYPNGKHTESIPYEKLFGEDDRKMFEGTMPVLPDHEDPGMLFRETLNLG